MTLNGKPLPKKVRDTVDPGIRKLVDDINKLPFVKQTVFSCAGYGPQGIGWYEDHEQPPHAPYRGMCQGYVMIEYDPRKDWREFHDDMLQTVDRVRDVRKSSRYWKKYKTGPLWNYELLSPVCAKLKPRWRRVERVVNRLK